MLRATLIFLIPAVLLTGCQQYESPELESETAKMGATERASYLAIDRYFTCIWRFERIAKKGPPLSDSEIDRFGYHCPAELREAARKRELYRSSQPARPDDDNDDKRLRTLPLAKRIAQHEKELAGALWCDFRKCWIA